MRVFVSVFAYGSGVGDAQLLRRLFPPVGVVFADSPTQETRRLSDGVSSLDTVLVGTVHHVNQILDL